HDEVRLLVRLLTGFECGKQFVEGRRLLRQDNRDSSSRNAAVYSYVSGMPAHHLDKEHAVMRERGIADLVNGFHSGVGSCVIANAEVASGKVVIDGAGYAYRGNAVYLVKFVEAGECTVSPDGIQGIDADLPETFVSPLPSFYRPELLTACRLQDGATPLNNVADRTCAQANNIALDHALVSAHDPVHFLLV